MPGLVAWATGIIVYYAASSFGGTLPSLVASITVYWLLSRGAVTT
jgi:hypothetical protein